MTVRLADVSDAAAVALVHVRTWQVVYRGHMPDDLLDNLSVEQRTSMWERLIPSGGVWVALDGSEVVGFAAAGPSRDDDASSELYAIYLLPSAWGSGLAEPLLTAALSGMTDTVLWVLDDNPRARRFYERLGFVLDGMTREEEFGSSVVKEVRYRR
ncbi:MAG TPA: GNAT family N-acetyltransferase [Lentzea sp.]